MKLNNKWIPVGTLVVVLAIGGMSAEAGQRENRGRERNGRASQGKPVRGATTRNRREIALTARPIAIRRAEATSRRQTRNRKRQQCRPRRGGSRRHSRGLLPRRKRGLRRPRQLGSSRRRKNGWRRHGLEPGRDRAFSPAPALKPSGPSSTPCRDTRVLCGRTTARFTRRPGSAETRMTRVITATTTVIATRVTGTTGIPIPRTDYGPPRVLYGVPAPRHYYGPGGSFSVYFGVGSGYLYGRPYAGPVYGYSGYSAPGVYGCARLLRRHSPPGAAARRPGLRGRLLQPASSTTSTAAFQRLTLEVGPHQIELVAPGLDSRVFEVYVDPARTVTIRADLFR